MIVKDFLPQIVAERLLCRIISFASIAQTKFSSVTAMKRSSKKTMTKASKWNQPNCSRGFPFSQRLLLEDVCCVLSSICLCWRMCGVSCC